MAYHVSLVNSEKNSSSKLIKNKNAFRAFLINNFNMIDSVDENGNLQLYYDKDDPSFTIFYTEGIEGEYYINTTDDEHIEKLIDIANKLNDGTRVKGDEGESYISLENTYIHPHDIKSIDISLTNKVRCLLRNNMCLIIWCIISILIVIVRAISDNIL